MVTNLPVGEGETVVVGIQNSPGSTLMTLADTSVITAEVMVDETDIVNVKLGQPAEVGIDEVIAEVLPAGKVDAVKQLQGSFSIVVLCDDDKSRLLAAQTATPIVIGLGHGENFIASDIPAILDHTREVLFLEDGEMAEVTREGVEVTTFDGEPVARTPKHITWDPVTAQKGGFKHFLLKEIHEQPRAISDTLLGRVDRQTGRVVFDGDMKMDDAFVRAIPRITFVACGTASYASLVGKYLIERLARIPCDVEIASEYRYRDPVVSPGQLLIAVTQSGETVDTLSAMDPGRERGARVLSVVNVVGSQASRVSDDVIYLHAGPEISVASTKAYTAMLVDLYLFAIYLAQRRGTIDQERSASLLAQVFHLPTLMDAVLREEPKMRALAHRYYASEHFLFLGRGANYPTALEGALKLKELSYIHAEGTAAGEMKHGTNALIDETLPVVAIALRDSTYRKIVSNIQEVRARAGIVIALANDDDQEIAQYADEIIRIPATNELLSPALAVVPLQLLAYHVADRRGNDVDQPRNLAKAVTVE